MTKGPWRYDPGFATGAILGADHEIVADGVRLEDAPVIEAAPELLEVLGDILNCAAFGAIPKHAWDRALAVRAKAEGREP
jgi:hypothetical protein